MTKEEFVKTLNVVDVLRDIADDTGRMPKERDLARIMHIATLLLIKGEYKSAKDILKIAGEELED